MATSGKEDKALLRRLRNKESAAASRDRAKQHMNELEAELLVLRER